MQPYQPFESEVSEMLKGSERNAECSFTMFSMLPAKRDQEGYQQQVEGLQKGDTVYRSSKVISGVTLSICLPHILN